MGHDIKGGADDALVLAIDQRSRRREWIGDQWELGNEAKGRAFAPLTDQRDVAAHGPGDGPRNRQPEPGAGAAILGRGPGLFIFTKDPRLIFRGNPDPGIANLDGDAADLAGVISGSFRVAIDVDGDTAGRGELDRIAGEIHQDTGQMRRVGQNRGRHRGSDKGRQLQTLRLGARRQQLHDFFNQRFERQGRMVQFHASRLDLAKIEHIVDQRQQGRAGRPHGPDVVCLFGGKARPLEQFRHAENAMQRGPQFVAGQRDKMRLGEIGRLHFGDCLSQIGDFAPQRRQFA